MAIAGDIIIKLAADFAAFSKGMADSAATLEKFGQKADTLSGQIDAAFKVIKGAAVVTAAAVAIRHVIDELDRLETKFTDVAEQAKKLGVDFGQFEALRVAALKGGVGIDALVGSMTKLKGVTEQALQGNAATIDQLNKLNVTILDHTGKLRSQEEINLKIAAAFDRMPAGIEKLRLQYSLLGEAGEDTDKKLKLLLATTEDASARAQSLTLEAAVVELKKMRDESKAAREEIDRMIASVILPIEATALKAISSAMADIMKSVREAELYSGNWLVRYLKARGSIGGTMNEAGNMVPGSPTEDALNRIVELQTRLADIQRMIDAGGHPTGRGTRIMGTLPDELVATNKEMAEVEARLKRINNLTMPVQTVVGDAFGPPEPPGRQPSKAAAGGGGGGKNDLDTIDALIARYGKMRDAALAASDALRADTSTDVRDLALVIEARQAAADAIAKIEARLGKQPQERIDALEKSISLAKQAQAEQQRELQYAAAADRTQKAFGDGTEAYADAVRELHRQQLTGRLEGDAYRRSLKQQSEAIDQAAHAAARYDDDLGSLAAGFESAAQSYQRSNDLFSQGGQLFTATSAAMGEGLDVLLGKSSKTFQQIAADFATMLAKMALQAALSKVFELIFGGGMASAGLTFASTPQSNAVWGSMGLTGRAGGGAVYGGQPYWVGEYGPERFVPQASGRIEPAGGGGDLYVSIANYTDSSVTAKKSKGPGGQLQLDVVVAAVESKMAARLSLGQGALGRTMEGKYALQQAGR